MPLPSELASWRQTRRNELLAQRMAIDPAQRKGWNARITDALLQMLDVEPGMVVSAYWPFKGEFDPRFALHAWRAHGACTALPIVVAKASALRFRAWWPGIRTTPGVYQLPVPEGDDITRPDVVLMPPVGFDAQGYRLGYGGGYYDRTLAALSPQPVKIGVGFALSRITTIQPQPHDIAMDFMVTEDGVLAVEPSGLLAPLEPAQARSRVQTALRVRG